ncbi:MAG: hypothetical protein V4512_16495 [Pseudomonadota bacterium]|uniref:hypothetical protein n=1 Tax=Sphingobium sp. KCTC 72723 TaxID=2733867 RepID=UPI0021D23DA5|nr:hypothetical protein [Sphingobium sp. KCTC 72723]
MVSAVSLGREAADGIVSPAIDMSEAETAAAADKVNAAKMAAFRRKLIITQKHAVLGRKRCFVTHIRQRLAAPRLRVYRVRPPWTTAATCAFSVGGALHNTLR